MPAHHVSLSPAVPLTGSGSVSAAELLTPGIFFGSIESC